MPSWSKNKRALVTFSSALAGVASVLYLSQKPAFCHSLSPDDFQQPEMICEDVLRKRECDKLIKRYQLEYGVPGMVVAVSKNGKLLYARGYGYSDVENNVRAHAHTVCRIASISKPITTAIAAKLYENNKLDFDNPITDYLKDLPPLKFKNKEYSITARQLACHMSGVRHYDKSPLQVEEEEVVDEENGGNTVKEAEKNIKNEKKPETTSDKKYDEFYSNKNFKTTKDALEQFIHDDLLYEPGARFYYTTHGYTLLSAVLERASGGKNNDFKSLFGELIRFMEMSETYLDENDPLIHNRSKYYTMNDKKRLRNVAYVDNSLKWAGGGMLSTVVDLAKFGNHMLFCYQNNDNNKLAFLKSSTIKDFLWLPHCVPKDFEKRKKNERPPLTDDTDTLAYGLGWDVCLNENEKIKYVYHTGGAVGAVSCLLIVPDEDEAKRKQVPSNGLVVVVFCNSDNAAEISKLSLKIAKIFKDKQ